eukprot:COSAG06_NODE_21676_length_749_cov_0.923077_1_plen_140_part_10
MLTLTTAYAAADIADATTRLACEALGKQHELTPEEYQLAVEAGQQSKSELQAKVNESVAMLQQEHCVMCMVHPASTVLEEPEPEPEEAEDDQDGAQKVVTHDLKSLRDLRSRALLYVNTSFQSRLNDDDDDDEVDTAKQQ